MTGLSLAPGVIAAAAVFAAVSPGPAPARRVARLAAGPRRDRPDRSDGSRSHPNDPRRRPPTEITQWLGRPVGAVGRVVRRLARRAPDPGLEQRVGAAVLAGVVGWCLLPVLAGPLAATAWLVPVCRDRAGERRRQARVADEAPDVVELFRLAIGAGLTVHQAVGAVAARVRGASALAVGEIAAQVAVGHRLADALDRFGAVDEAVRPLAAALAAAERYGVPLGPTLDRLAVDARHHRRRRAEEVARRLPVQMLFPLVLCILPAFALLTVVPLVVAAIRGLPT